MNSSASRDRPRGFEPVDHTADIGLRAWGPTLEDLFAQAAFGMTDLLVDSGRIRQREERRVAVPAGDLEEVLVGWLQEILYLHEVGRFVASEFRVARAGSDGVEATLLGEPIDRERHAPRMDIKAATYHDLRIERTRGADGCERFETVIIFDV